MTATRTIEPPTAEPSESQPAIFARNLIRDYGRGQAAVRAVDQVDLTVQEGEVVLVFGPSGCGKSTLLSIIGGLDRAYTGTLRLFGQDATAMGDARLSRLRGERIGFVFQTFHLLGHLSVLQNVTAASLFARGGQTAGQALERGQSVLERVGLAGHASKMPAELSGGQRQRVAIARALFQRPQLLLCDEPTGNLDRDTGAQIIELFAALHEQLHTTLVIVTHEDRMAAIVHRRLNMIDGRLAAAEAGA